MVTSAEVRNLPLRALADRRILLDGNCTAARIEGGRAVRRGCVPGGERCPGEHHGVALLRSSTRRYVPDLPCGRRADPDPPLGRDERHPRGTTSVARERASRVAGEDRHRRLGERALLRPRDVRGRPGRVRPAHRAPASPRRASRGGRPADADVAGLQLPRRQPRWATGHMVRRQRRGRPSLPALSRPRRAFPLPSLRPAVHPLAHAHGQARRLPRRWRPRPSRRTRAGSRGPTT